MKKFNFNDLFVLDLANNHQGDIEHGKAIIKSCASIAQSYDARVAVKFQFRDLPRFVSKSQLANPTNKHVPRFLSTMLDWSAFKEMADEAKAEGCFTMCTPFDETSVDRIAEMGFDLIKVASCSARDWPLLEAVAATGLPVVASTGGLAQSEVDDLVSFLNHRGCDWALMHCVSLYPTPDEACNIANIGGFVERYSGKTIGWSTHEDPEDVVHVGLALAQGARMFEKHVGVETETIKLNKYSANPDQLRAWFEAHQRATRILGSRARQNPSPEEKEAIDGLARGVFAKVKIEAGEVVRKEDIYFAFPLEKGQLSSGEWKDGIVLGETIGGDSRLQTANCTIPADPEESLLKKAIHEVKAMLAQARVPLTHEFTTEYSHHYGVRNFREVGAVLINVVNRAYAKKILVQLPGQRHPHHYHKLKEETFIVLWGELLSDLDGRERLLKPGDTLTVPPGVWHSFRTDAGCVFEEISTTAYSNDSVYRDPAVNELTSAQRKTSVDHWGRFQIKEQLRGEPLVS